MEDNEDIRQMHGDLFTFVGLRVAEARDGSEAILMSAQLKPDLIIMDMALWTWRSPAWMERAQLRS